MLLSVLIPSLPERLEKLRELLSVLEAQSHPEMEVLVLMDNRRRNLGVKRNDLIRMARGKFIANIDDDDLVAPNYFASIADALREDVDLVAYDALCSLNGARYFRVNTGMGFPNEQPQHLPGGGYSDIRRTPWHWCAWRRELALGCPFAEDRNYGDEDARWLALTLPKVKTWRKVDAPIFIHRYDARSTTFAS